MKTCTTLLVLAAIIGLTVAVNYCDKNLCSFGTHIACRHSGQFDSICPRNAALVKITKKLKDQIVDAFNENRNFIAGGGDPQHKPACRMATMEWDSELAKLAELNVKQCRMNHEACHNTKNFPLSGQNLAWMTFYDKPIYKDLVQQSIKMWYDEVKQSRMEYIRSYPRKPPAMIGHFTAMVADRNYRLGCAASTYQAANDKHKQFLFACNFAFNNMVGEPIYKDCDMPAKDCGTGKNKKYPNLCSKSEKYTVRFEWNS